MKTERWDSAKKHREIIKEYQNVLNILNQMEKTKEEIKELEIKAKDYDRIADKMAEFYSEEATIREEFGY